MVTFTPDSQTGVNKIADFVFLPYISFIYAFTALECVKSCWETICAEFILLVRFTPDPPSWVKLGS